MMIPDEGRIKYKNTNEFFNKVKIYTKAGIIETLSSGQYIANFDSKNNILKKIIRRNGLKSFSECSEEMQDAIKIVYGMEETERLFIHRERKHLLDNLKHIKIIGAIKSAYAILFLFFTKEKSHRRIINIGKNISYEGIDKDKKYLEDTIRYVSNPERKSIITYLLGKIKDNKMKKRLKRLGKNPSQFDLLLQQCKKGQIMFTNGLNLDGSSSLFKELTQAVSGARRCHCLVISDIIKDKHGIVKDLKVIQSTLDGGVHEISFRKYIKENYSKSDFLLASFPKDKRNPIVINAKNHIGQKYDRIAMILDIVTGGDFKYLGKDIKDVNKTYCTALIIDALEKSNNSVPDSHMTPADILRIENLTPEYACYCDKL